MPISGAAASTNMGWQTLRRLRFVMTLFNVRFGYSGIGTATKVDLRAMFLSTQNIAIRPDEALGLSWRRAVSDQ